MDTDTGEYAMADGGEADPGTGPALSHRVRSSSDGTGACNLLDADKAREALQSNNSSFMLQDGRVRVSSTRRVNPLFGSQTGNCDSGADGPTSISEIEECAELSWGRDEADEADDVGELSQGPKREVDQSQQAQETVVDSIGFDNDEGVQKAFKAFQEANKAQRNNERESCSSCCRQKDQKWTR